jgi:diaminopimelate epimerase
VIFVDTDPSTLPQKFGPELEVHSLFPAKTNVEFVRVTSNDHMIMRVWERGSGETFSCGTGACASAVAAILKGLVGERVIVSLLGGDLEIQWKKESSSVFMKGPARKVFEGTYNF